MTPENGAILQTDGISFAYNGQSVVEDVSIGVGRREFVALVGPNGSGKTTLVRLILGLLRPSAGRAMLFGEDPQRFRDRWRLGYVPQRPQLAASLPATVEEIVTTGRLARGRWWRRVGAKDRGAIAHALEIVELESLRDKRVSELSGGQQQRAFIARALASEPELLVLDEPIAGVDSEAQARFRDALVHHVLAHDGSVLLVSHELSSVAGDLDRVIVLRNRVRFDGTPQQLIESGVSLGVHAEDLPAWLEELR